MENELLFKEEVYRIVGAAIEVYNELGAGFLESVYQEAMEIELASRQVAFVPQVPVRVRYKGQILKKGFFADLICCSAVIVELKATSSTTKADEAQLLNYLRATDLRVGLLINFGDPGRLDWTRFVH